MPKIRLVFAFVLVSLLVALISNQLTEPAFARASSGLPPFALDPRCIVNIETTISFANAQLGDAQVIYKVPSGYHFIATTYSDWTTSNPSSLRLSWVERDGATDRVLWSAEHNGTLGEFVIGYARTQSIVPGLRFAPGADAIVRLDTASASPINWSDVPIRLHGYIVPE